jgi:hypothetical protein
MAAAGGGRKWSQRPEQARGTDRSRRVRGLTLAARATARPRGVARAHVKSGRTGRVAGMGRSDVQGAGPAASVWAGLRCCQARMHLHAPDTRMSSVGLMDTRVRGADGHCWT